MSKVEFLKKLFIRVINAPRILYALYHFEKAWKFLENKNYIEADKVFEKGMKFINSLPYEYSIMRAQIYLNINKREEFIKLQKHNWHCVDKEKSISDEEKLYFKEYISTGLKAYEKYFSFDKDDIKYGRIEDVDLKKISNRIKRTFPLRHHPDWNKYGDE